ncbi:Fc.00g078130.m01.CDS01 [Cosmosporella sp. VM-42]
MLPKHLLALSALFVVTWAQSSQGQDPVPTNVVSTTSRESETATSTATGIATHTVNVGANGHKFKPEQVEAKVGDIIEWVFYPTGHWIIRGDYDWPCVPYEYIGTNRKGFSSGAQSVQAITDDGPKFQVRVNNTDPIFFYCGAPGSCVQYKMMGVVNPSKNETLDGWLDNAKDQDYQLTPGEPWPAEGGPSGTASGTGAPKSTGGSSNDDDDNDNHGHSSLSPGAIAGIAIGGAAIVILGAGLIYLCGRRGGFDKAYRKSFRNSAVPTAAYGAAPPVVEANYATPSTTGDVWSNKSPAFGQSPPMSPQPAPGYGFPQGMGTMGSQDGSTMNTY